MVSMGSRDHIHGLSMLSARVLERICILQALSMGVHESQSLLWERMVALSLPFSRYLAPKLAAAFPQLGNLQVRPAACYHGPKTALLAISLAAPNIPAVGGKHSPEPGLA